MKKLKNLLLLTLLSATGFFCSTSLSQTNGGIFGDGYSLRVTSNLSEPYTAGDSTSLSVTATTSTFNPPFFNGYTSHLWVTLGRPTLADAPRSSVSTFEILVPDGETRLSLSTSGFGNINTTPANIVGNSLFFTVCIDLQNAFTPDPNGDLCFSDRVLVHPRSPDFLESPPRQDSDQATIYWERLPTSNGQTIGSRHKLTLSNQNDPNDQLVTYIEDGSSTGVFQGQNRNRLILNNSGIDPLTIPNRDGFVAQLGQAYRATLETCANLACSEGISISNVTRFASPDSGLFTASTGSFNDAIMVNWVTHHPGTSSYYLKRCEFGTNNCDGMETGNTPFFRDTNINPETNYQYTVFACDDSICNESVGIPTGRTNIGFATLFLPDCFEIDDSPQSLKLDPLRSTNPECENATHTITSGTTQTRSFHEADDQDWTRIEIPGSVTQLRVRTNSLSSLNSTANLDTQLSLFDASGEFVICAAGVNQEVTSEAQFVIPVTAGDQYFLRVEQRTQTGVPLRPIQEYFLDAEMILGSNVIQQGIPCDFLGADPFPRPTIAPVINLLLNDE